MMKSKDAGPQHGEGRSWVQYLNKVTMKAAQPMRRVNFSLHKNEWKSSMMSWDVGYLPQINVKKGCCVNSNEPARVAAGSARLIEGYSDVFSERVYTYPFLLCYKKRWEFVGLPSNVTLTATCLSSSACVLVETVVMCGMSRLCRVR